MAKTASAVQVFFKTVRQQMEPVPPSVAPDTPLLALVGEMATRKLSAVTVTDPTNRPIGIVTEQDIVRRVAFNAESGQPSDHLVIDGVGGVVALGDAEDLLPCPVRCSPDTFVLRVRGESMEPKFHDGDLIFVDPQVAPVSGRYVVVRLEDSQEATFKQLIVEEGRQYLKALNPDWPHRIIEVNVDATICGVIVFKGELV